MKKFKGALQNLFINLALSACFALALFPKRRLNPKYLIFSLTEEQAIRNQSTSSLCSFLNEARFGFDAQHRNILVEVRKYKYIWTGRKISVTYDIPLSLLFNCIKRRNLLSIYLDMVRQTYARGEGSLSLLDWKRNIFDYRILQEILDYSPTDLFLFTTQSSAFKLPSAFALPKNTKVRKIMFWYGTNTEPIDGCSTSEEKHSNANQLNDCIDHHYVWDKFQSEVLTKKGLINVEIKGSILFISRDLMKINFKVPTIIYFDVTPHARSTSSYTEEFCISNLNEIISVCDEISKQTNTRINLLVKPKRNYERSHSKKYINLLRGLQADERIEILDSATNIYNLVASADLTLGIVFTSPVLIAKELNKPSAFVAISGGWISDEYNQIKVITSKTGLKKIILSSLRLDHTVDLITFE